EIAQLALVVGDAGAGQRLERAGETRARAPRAFGDAALLAPVLGQEHHDPVRLGELIGAQDQRVGGVDGHGYRNRKNTVPSPSHDANPNTSVSVVMKTEEASAGSTFIARSASGIRVPAVAATNMLITIAAQRIAPSHGLPFQ